MLILLTQTANDPIIQFSFQSAGHTYQYSITEEMLKKGPTWTNADNPPLSFKAAEKIAKDYATKALPNQNLEATSISLKKVSLVDRWYYEVDLEPPALDTSSNVIYEVVILMDGTVVAPLKIN